MSLNNRPLAWVHNKSPDETVRALFRSICLRPAMYVGKEDYKLTATLLEGIALGYQKWHGGFMHSFLHEEFQQFLGKKYRHGTFTYNDIGWSEIIPLSLGAAMSEKQMIDRLLADFEDFNNVLVRMSVETSGEGGPSVVEDK